LVALNPRLADRDASWLLDTAAKCLKQAVTTRGVGAKTAAGYGWFDEPATIASGVIGGNAVGARTQPFAPPPDEEQQLIRALRPLAGNTANFRALLPKLKAIADGGQLDRVFDAIIPAQELRNFRKTNRYWQSFQSNPDGRAVLKRLGREPE
jgi:hypothetical protein